MTDDILEDLKLRDAFLLKFRKEGNPELYSSYCKLRNKIQRVIRKAKNSHFENKVNENMHDSKKLWKQMKLLGYQNVQKTPTQTVLKIHMCS